ncbi:MAG: glycosyltransferase family 9 protein [Gammaproteobacteria bacterium]|nr:glycosyltransferase family 9 protein [Gammaproteobacteria bacterium]NIR28882.1 glycosyltransferase family 9 protein [Gammaproteobacteria bacterium]NIR97278.1 glycosyltransferase family 9 protein [Gammaproteobacteria bacterium]NIT62978.1 glycosyltransferase family 9 protein [Gammaproteobacteria bacterium]NIV19937.1 glycosyltransferase family 9 protein [Gammaproteobacteria bacterium]
MSERVHSLTARDDVRRILVIKWSAMGDVALGSILFEDIYRAFPGREIHLNTLPQWVGLFRADPRFNEIIAIDVRHSLRAGLRWVREIRRRRYDLVVDLQTTDRSALLLALVQLTGGGIRYRIGNNRRMPYNIYPAGDPLPPRALDRSRIALRAAGIATETPRPALHVPQENRRKVERLMRESGLEPDRYALFVPGSQAGGHLKRWGAGRYAQLARLLRGQGLEKIALVGGPDDMDECARVARDGGEGVVNLCGRTAVLDIIPLAEGARVIVSNDTGPAHVASAADRPMAVICGPTDPRRVKPAGDNVVTVQADLPCINCYRKECSHHSCMPAITPERVLAALRSDGRTGLAPAGHTTARQFRP